MGLDMYLYKVTRLTDDEFKQINKSRAESVSRKYSVIDKEEFDSDPNSGADLIPFFRETKLVCSMFDKTRLFKESGIDEDDDIIGEYYHMNGRGWSFRSGKRIDISEEEADNYMYDSLRDVYVFHKENVAYWRKYYDLHDFIEANRIKKCSTQAIIDGCTITEEDVASWAIENCGYYQLNKKEKLDIKEFLISERVDSQSPDEYEDAEFWENDDNIFYVAWW